MDRERVLDLLTQMRDNCLPRDGEAYDDPLRKEKFMALNYAVDLIGIPTAEAVMMANEDQFVVVEESHFEIYSKAEFYATPTPKPINEKTGD